MRLNIFNALFKKDMKNCFVNKNILLMVLLPLLFAGIYSVIYGGANGISTELIMMLCTTIVICIIPLNVLSLMIAEEKEKHTLRSLMMAGVRGSEFLISKAAVTLILMLIDAVAIFFLFNQSITYFPTYLLAMLGGSLGIIVLSAVIGIAAKDQMAAGTLAAPFMLIIMFPTMFSEFNDFLGVIAKAFPTMSVQTMYFSVVNGHSFFESGNLIAMGVCLFWIVIGLIAFSITYKKKGLDD